MENKYHTLGKRDEELLSISSAIEDIAYLLTIRDDVAYSIVAGKCKCGTCQCSSSRSSGGTCRASSLEMKE
jgi:hypothetical protein